MKELRTQEDAVGWAKQGQPIIEKAIRKYRPLSCLDDDDFRIEAIIVADDTLAAMLRLTQLESLPRFRFEQGFKRAYDRKCRLLVKLHPGNGGGGGGGGEPLPFPTPKEADCFKMAA